MRGLRVYVFFDFWMLGVFRVEFVFGFMCCVWWLEGLAGSEFSFWVLEEGFGREGRCGYIEVIGGNCGRCLVFRMRF